MSNELVLDDGTSANFVRAFATVPPELSVLSDLALEEDTAHLDRFDLREKMGPIYDILRHPNTKTPMTIAIYGDWGSGKTTAMRWLQRLLREWTSDKASDKSVEDKIKVSTIWFDPWKYDTKQEVWRGLLAEVIITILKEGNTTLNQVREAIVKFGRALGRAFVYTAAGLTLKTPEGSPVSAELSLEGLKDILNEAPEAPPEKAFLNEFETTMKEWVRRLLARKDGGQRRVAVFIDDLDRCMPEVALQVLEALKLYLGIPGLIFVVGVDRRVIDELVMGHYEKLKLSQEKSAKYLAKMFQVEVSIEPRDLQIETFLLQQLEGVKYWKEMPHEKQNLFRRMALAFAEHNPREIKRVLNSAVLLGAGRMIRLRASEKKAAGTLPFEQGLQEYFMRRVLEREPHLLPALLRERHSRDFFCKWSALVRQDSTEPPTAVVPKSLYEKSADRESLGMHEEVRPLDLSSISASHRNLVSEVLTKGQRPGELLPLLADRLLGELMRVEFPADEPSRATTIELEARPTIAIKARAAVAVEQMESLYQRIARAAGVSSEDARGGRFDPTRVKHLDLMQLALTEISPLARLVALEALGLGSTQVTDLSPLGGLKSLRSIGLSKTPVTDLGPLAGLTALVELDLNATPVTDLTPLAGLIALVGLYLAETPVVNLAPLRGLRALEALDLTKTRVEDLGPLAGLPCLRDLGLDFTPVIDLTPLGEVKGLQEIHLKSTSVRDLTPLEGLESLAVLELDGTAVRDLAPLHNSKVLARLTLPSTGVADISPLAGLRRLTQIDLRETQVLDLGPLHKIFEGGRRGEIDIRHTPAASASARDSLRVFKKACPNVRVHFEDNHPLDY